MAKLLEKTQEEDPEKALAKSGLGAEYATPGVRFRSQGAGCRVQGAGCRVQGAECRVQGAGFHF